MRYPTREYQTDKPSRKVSLFISTFYFRFFQKNKEKIIPILDREAHHIRGSLYLKPERQEYIKELKALLKNTLKIKMYWKLLAEQAFGQKLFLKYQIILWQ